MVRFSHTGKGTSLIPSVEKGVLLSKRLKTKKGAAVAILALALLIVGAAFAAWLFTSSGNGAGKTASVTAADVVVTPASVTGPGCVPGGTCDLFLSVTNNSEVDVTVNTITAAGSAVASNPGCVGGNFSLAAQSPGTVVSPGSTDEFIMSNAVTLASSAPYPDCNGVSFTYPVDVAWSVGS